MCEVHLLLQKKKRKKEKKREELKNDFFFHLILSQIYLFGLKCVTPRTDRKFTRLGTPHAWLAMEMLMLKETVIWTNSLLN